MKRPLWLLCFLCYLCASLACQDHRPSYRSYLPPMPGSRSPVMLAQASVPGGIKGEVKQEQARSEGEGEGTDDMSAKTALPVKEEAKDPCQVDLNSAPSSLLQTLPGIGPATAKKIIQAREKRPFSRLSQVQRVKGIGPATYAKIKAAACVRPGAN